MLAQTASLQQRAAMYNANAFKIGLFGANCSSGRSATKVPERWSASWPDCLKLARMADDAGIDFMLPIGRWKGYGGDTNFHGSTLETVTWAAGLLAATKHITVFGTVHAPLFNPIIAAKEFVTVDHIGEGRFGIDEAIEHIRAYTSGHTEVIVTKDIDNAETFVTAIDAAAVGVNVSTRFTDGAARRATSVPARVEPVNDTMSMSGWLDNGTPTPGPSP